MLCEGPICRRCHAESVVTLGESMHPGAVTVLTTHAVSSGAQGSCCVSLTSCHDLCPYVCAQSADGGILSARTQNVHWLEMALFRRASPGRHSVKVGNFHVHSYCRPSCLKPCVRESADLLYRLRLTCRRPNNCHDPGTFLMSFLP
jgi:hypothetical protein